MCSGRKRLPDIDCSQKQKTRRRISMFVRTKWSPRLVDSSCGRDKQLRAWERYSDKCPSAVDSGGQRKWLEINSQQKPEWWGPGRRRPRRGPSEACCWLIESVFVGRPQILQPARNDHQVVPVDTWNLPFRNWSGPMKIFHFLFFWKPVWIYFNRIYLKEKSKSNVENSIYWWC